MASSVEAAIFGGSNERWCGARSGWIGERSRGGGWLSQIQEGCYYSFV